MTDQNLDALLAEANQVGLMAMRLAVKIEALAQGRAGETSAPDRDPLKPVREAMRQYDFAVAAGQHGRIAAAQFVDAIYAALAPASERVVEVVAVEETDAAEPQPLQLDPSDPEAAQWCG